MPVSALDAGAAAATRTLPDAVAEAADWGVIMAVITLSVFPTVAIYIMMQRYFVQGVALSGIKG